MEWIKINIEALPEGVVLAANFEEGSYGYKEKLIGYLSADGQDVECEDENTILQNVTHYIDIHKHDPQ